MCCKVAFPCQRVFAGEFAETRYIFGEAFEFGVHHGIGTVCRYHATIPVTVPDRPVMFERIER